MMLLACVIMCMCSCDWCACVSASWCTSAPVWSEYVHTCGRVCVHCVCVCGRPGAHVCLLAHKHVQDRLCVRARFHARTCWTVCACVHVLARSRAGPGARVCTFLCTHVLSRVCVSARFQARARTRRGGACTQAC